MTAPPQMTPESIERHPLVAARLGPEPRALERAGELRGEQTASTFS